MYIVIHLTDNKSAESTAAIDWTVDANANTNKISNQIILKVQQNYFQIYKILDFSAKSFFLCSKKKSNIC